MNFKLKKTIEGSLLKVLEETQEQAERLNDVSAVIDGKTWKRIETISFEYTQNQQSLQVCMNIYSMSMQKTVYYIEGEGKNGGP